MLPHRANHFAFICPRHHSPSHSFHISYHVSVAHLHFLDCRLLDLAWLHAVLELIASLNGCTLPDITVYLDCLFYRLHSVALVVV
jgi:hypothetical protein